MNYRNERNYENLTKLAFEGVGRYGVPQIEPTHVDTCEFIGFNYAPTCKAPGGKGVHFFLDDYQFTRVWNNPNKYIDILGRFKHVMTPDFSTYSDFPMALQIYNHYRKHWLGAYWQANGISVIPTISWSTEESFEWCFDGEPMHSTVAVSSVGTQMNKRSKKLFVDGYEKMVKVLKPETILFYGKVPEECLGNIIEIKTFQDKFG